jgi:predicted nucleotidyltransferase
MLVRELGRQIQTHPSPRRALRKLLVSRTVPPELRKQAAYALATGTSDKKRLFAVLEQKDEELSVRGACASSLRNVALSGSDETVVARLKQIVNSDEPEALRIGAAYGLEKAAEHDRDTTTALLTVATLDAATDRLRSACAWALEPQIGRNSEVRSAFETWLDIPKNSKLRRVAAQAMAHYMADEPSAWEHELVEKIENILMNLDDPCPHALDSLEAIATAREVQRGLRLENVLRDLLKPVERRVELAFVFGSTARKRQTQDSDIDLMVIGDVSLKELSTPLRQAEKTLGRRINPALYSRGDAQRKYQSGDPFLIDVYRREKIPVWPADISRKDLDDELGAMVAERVAETV